MMGNRYTNRRTEQTARSTTDANEKLISVVVPIYNEALNVPILVAEIARQADALSYAFEFILVDDGRLSVPSRCAYRIYSLPMSTVMI